MWSNVEIRFNTYSSLKNYPFCRILAQFEMQASFLYHAPLDRKAVGIVTYTLGREKGSGDVHIDSLPFQPAQLRVLSLVCALA